MLAQLLSPAQWEEHLMTSNKVKSLIPPLKHLLMFSLLIKVSLTTVFFLTCVSFPHPLNSSFLYSLGLTQCLKYRKSLITNFEIKKWMGKVNFKHNLIANVWRWNLMLKFYSENFFLFIPGIISRGTQWWYLLLIPPGEVLRRWQERMWYSLACDGLWLRDTFHVIVADLTGTFMGTRGGQIPPFLFIVCYQ